MSVVVGVVALYVGRGPREVAWIQWVLNFLDTAAPGWEPIYLLSFVVLGIMTHLTWPKGRMWQVASGILAAAACVEIVQIWIPVDKAAVSHAVLDFGLGVIGFGAVWLADYAWGTVSFPSEYQHSTL